MCAGYMSQVQPMRVEVGRESILRIGRSIGASHGVIKYSGGGTPVGRIVICGIGVIFPGGYCWPFIESRGFASA